MSSMFAENVRQFHALFQAYWPTRGEELGGVVAIARERVISSLMSMKLSDFNSFQQSEAMSNVRFILGKMSHFQLLQSLPKTSAYDVQARWINEPGLTLPRLLAAMLLLPALRFRSITEGFDEFFFIREFELYISTAPQGFLQDSDRGLYVKYLVDVCGVLADRIETDKSASCFALAEGFLTYLKTGSIYSCDGNLKEYAVAKGRLIGGYLKRKYGPELSEWAPDALRREGPKRVGILWHDADRRTENILALASIQAFRDAGIEVTSLVLRRGFGSKFQETLESKIRGVSDNYHTLFGMPLQDVASSIRALDLDLLMFASNVTWGYDEHIALASLKLARRQAVNICAVYTTGFPSMDYYFSGASAERGDDPASGFSEQLVTLDGGCLIFDQEDYPRVSLRGDLRETALKRYSTVFASGANLYKLHPRLLGVWAQILSQVPGSALVLYPFNPNWDSAYWSSQLKRLFETELRAHGVSPERVFFAGPWKSASKVRELLTGVDVYLDSFPHSGGLSSLDAMSLAIPIVTKIGMTQRENQSAELLEGIGLDRMIAEDETAYIKRAVSLATDPDLWAEDHLALAEKITDAPFFDGRNHSEAFARLIGSLVGETSIAGVN